MTNERRSPKSEPDACAPALFESRHSTLVMRTFPSSIGMGTDLSGRGVSSSVLFPSPWPPLQGLRGTSYPGFIASRRANPNGVASEYVKHGHNPVGVGTWFARFPRVARRLATLGWRTKSLWDCPRWHPGLVGNDKPRAGRGRGGTHGPNFQPASTIVWCIHSDLIRAFRLEIPSPATILTPCRYTSFIAGSADGTARYLSVHGIGRERHALTVVRPGSTRSCPSLPPAVAPTRPRPVLASRVHAGCAERGGRIRTEYLRRRGAPYAGKKPGSLGVPPSGGSAASFNLVQAVRTPGRLKAG